MQRKIPPIQILPDGKLSVVLPHVDGVTLFLCIFNGITAEQTIQIRFVRGERIVDSIGVDVTES
jgi:hypothetical protein